MEHAGWTQVTEPAPVQPKIEPLGQFTKGWTIHEGYAYLVDLEGNLWKSDVPIAPYPLERREPTSSAIWGKVKSLFHALLC